MPKTSSTVSGLVDVPAPRLYESLLPKSGELGMPEIGNASIERTTPRQTSGAVELSDVFDVPLSYREEHYGSRAVAKIVASKANAFGWRFESVDGDPLLRAVLFESLRDERNRRRVPGLIDLLGMKEVLVVLSVELVDVDDPAHTKADTITLEAHTVRVIRRVFNTPIGIKPDPITWTHAGVPVPDEDSRKAIRRDRSRTARFETSPAYVGPIRDRDP
jgi:hypothetical protein